MAPLISTITHICRLENWWKIVEKIMYSKWVTIRRALWSGETTEPFFFQNEAGNAQTTVNGESYFNIIIPFFVTVERYRSWKQLVSAGWRSLPYSSWNIDGFVRLFTWLHQLPYRWLGLVNKVLWFNAHGHSSVGFLKTLVYANKPTTIQILKTEIERHNTVTAICWMCYYILT